MKQEPCLDEAIAQHLIADQDRGSLESRIPFEIACYHSTNNATDPMSWNPWRSFLKGCLGQEVRLPEQRQHVLRVLVCKR